MAESAEYSLHEHQILARLKPDEADAHFGLAMALEKRNENAEAFKVYDVVLKLDPYHARAHLHEGFLFVCFGDRSQALQRWEEAWQLDPDLGKVFSDKEYAAYYEKKIQEALKPFQQAVTKNADAPRAHLQLGLAHRLLGQPGPALECLSRARELDARLWEAYAASGRIYATQGQHHRAILHLSKGIEINPADEGMQRDLGVAYEHVNKHEKALQHLERALDLNPRSSAALSHLIRVSRRIGDTQRAVRRLEQCLASHQGSVDAGELAQFIEYCMHDESLQPRDIDALLKELLLPSRGEKTSPRPSEAAEVAVERKVPVSDDTLTVERKLPLSDDALTVERKGSTPFDAEELAVEREVKTPLNNVATTDGHAPVASGTSVDRLIEGALEAHLCGRDDESIDLFQQLIYQKPDCYRAYFHMGSILRGLGDRVTAKTLFREGFELATSARDSEFVRVFQAALDDLTPAANVVGHAVEPDGGLTAASTGSSTTPRVGTIPSAEAPKGEPPISPAPKEALSIPPAETAISAHSIGREAGAAVPTGAPEPPVSLSPLTALDTEETIPWLQQATQREPENVTLLLKLARAYCVGRPALAVLQYQKAIALDPNPQYYVELGEVYDRLGKLEAAYRAYSKAAEMAPRSLDAVHRLIPMLIGREEWKHAVELIECALSDTALSEDDRARLMGQLEEICDKVDTISLELGSPASVPTPAQDERVSRAAVSAGEEVTVEGRAVEVEPPRAKSVIQVKPVEVTEPSVDKGIVEAPAAAMAPPSKVVSVGAPAEVTRTFGPATSSEAPVAEVGVASIEVSAAEVTASSGGALPPQQPAEGFSVPRPVAVAESTDEAGAGKDAGDRPPCILLAEDDPYLRDMTEIVLKRGGFTVKTARDGEEALELARTVVPDVVLLDVNMPRLDGFEVARAMKRNSATRAIPVIFLTARSASTDLLMGYEAGAAHYVTKPFDNQKLLSAVREAINVTVRG